VSEYLVPTSFQALDGWGADDHRAAFDAFLVSARRMLDKPYKTRALGIESAALLNTARAAFHMGQVGTSQARVFFEDNFVPHRFKDTAVETAGFLTGYFEPLVPASRHKTPRFTVPLYRRPPDLVDVGAHNRPAGMASSFRYARKTPQGLEEYFDRAAIQSGALNAKGLELVWLENKVEAFFIHVQGSAKLSLDDGSFMRVTYAAKSGHPYTSVGKVLSNKTGIPPARMTADRLAGWMYANPAEIDALLAHNRSFIFFHEVTGLDPDAGPLAAAKVPLVAGRSLAVDRTLHTFGTPIWVATKEALPGDSKPLARLMIAHDTGSAIVGPARGDVFVGTGEEAGMIAGKVRHRASMIVLVPKAMKQ